MNFSVFASEFRKTFPKLQTKQEYKIGNNKMEIKDLMFESIHMRAKKVLDFINVAIRHPNFNCVECLGEA